MVHQSPLDESLDAISGYFLGDATMSETLTKVSLAAMVASPSAAYVGLTMKIDRRVDTYVFTHPDLPEIDRAQYESARGPCVDAWRDGVSHMILDTRTERRWPEFCAVADANGIRSTCSLPMLAGERSVGAMNLYATMDHGFTLEDLRALWVFAAQAAYLLVNTQTFWDSRSLGENLTTAVATRSVIEQAKGVIMAARGGSAEEAFQTLVDQSQHENRKLRDLAAEIVRNAQLRRIG